MPPLNAVRAFEAAARTGGFRAAGAELNVAANAIGRLVRVLEDWLGVTLFKRLARGVVLTDVGRTYLSTVEAVFGELAEATAELQRRETSKVLTVSAGPSLASRWLIPRLGRLVEQQRGLDVRVLASAPLIDFTREEVDVAIRHGSGNCEGLRCDLLMEEEFFPVCSPTLLARGPRLREPADLSRHVLLHQQYFPSHRERDHGISDQFGWTDWLEATGAGDVDARQGLYFSFSHLALETAAEGQGIALASSAYVAGDLASGRLVRPFGALSVRGSAAFFIVCPPETAGRDKIAAFRNWALAEAGSMLRLQGIATCSNLFD